MKFWRATPLCPLQHLNTATVAKQKNARPWATQARLIRLSRMSRNQRAIVHWKWLHKMLRERGLSLWTWRDTDPRPPAFVGGGVWGKNLRDFFAKKIGGGGGPGGNADPPLAKQEENKKHTRLWC